MQKRSRLPAGILGIRDSFQAVGGRPERTDRRRLHSALEQQKQHGKDPDRGPQPPVDPLPPRFEGIRARIRLPIQFRSLHRFRRPVGSALVLVQLALEAVTDDFLLFGVLDVLKTHHDQVLVGLHRHDAHDFAIEFGVGQVAVLIIKQQPA